MNIIQYGVTGKSLKGEKFPSKNVNLKNRPGRMSKRTKGHRNSANNVRRKLRKMLKM